MLSKEWKYAERKPQKIKIFTDFSGNHRIPVKDLKPKSIV